MQSLLSVSFVSTGAKPLGLAALGAKDTIYFLGGKDGKTGWAEMKGRRVLLAPSSARSTLASSH